MLTLHYDYTSAASAVAVLRVQRLADRGAAVEFVGIDVLGLEMAVPVTLDQLDELDRHAPRAQALGLTLARPRLRPPTLGAHLVGALAVAHGLGAAWRRAVLEAYWSHGRDIGARDVLVGLGTGIGLDAHEVGAWHDDRARRLELRRAMAAERGRGVGGVPILEFQGTFVAVDLGDDDLARLAEL